MGQEGRESGPGRVRRAGALSGWLVTSKLANYVGTDQPLTLPVTDLTSNSRALGAAHTGVGVVCLLASREHLAFTDG